VLEAGFSTMNSEENQISLDSYMTRLASGWKIDLEFEFEVYQMTSSRGVVDLCTEKSANCEIFVLTIGRRTHL